MPVLVHRTRYGPSNRSLRIFPIALALGSFILLAGCGSSRPALYHSIELPPSAPRASLPDPFPVSLLVGHFTAPHLYREDRLVYWTPNGEIRTYHSHRWVEPPSEIVEHLLLQSLRDSGRFRGVQAQRSSARGDFVLRGRLSNFDEVIGPRPSARIRLEAELYDARKGATVWSHSFSEDEPVQGKGIDAVVDALRQATGRVVAGVSSSLAEYFSTHPET